MERKILYKICKRKEENKMEIKYHEEQSQFLHESMEQLFLQDKWPQALELARNRVNNQTPKKILWKIVDLVRTHMNDDSNKIPKTQEFCAIILDVAVDHIDSEEALSELIVYAEGTSNDLMFVHLLVPLRSCLRKIIKNRGQFIEKCLKTIHRRLNACHLASESVKENESDSIVKQSGNDIYAKKVQIIYQKIFEFYRPLVQQVLQHTEITLRKKAVEKQKAHLVCFLVQLLVKPLVNLDLQDRKVRSETRFLACAVVNDLSKVLSDFFVFLELIEQREINNRCLSPHDQSFITLDNNKNIPIVGIANLYYMLLVEEVYTSAIHWVYDPIYVWMNTIYLSISLIILEADCQGTVKGLLLFEKITSRLKDKSVPSQVLDSTVHKRLFQVIGDTYSRYEPQIIKDFILNCVELYLKKFDSKGRYLLLANAICINSVIKSPELMGSLLLILTVTIDESLEMSPIPAYFSGSRLFNLLTSYTRWKVGDNDVDPADCHCQIAAAFKILHLLYTKDRKNVTGIRDHLKYFKNNFFLPVVKAFKKSRLGNAWRLKDLEGFLKTFGRRKFSKDVPLFIQESLSSDAMRVEAEELLCSARIAHVALNELEHCMYKYNLGIEMGILNSMKRVTN